jgi:hypothetical protein
MLNNGGHANGNAIGTKEGTQAEAYDIEGHPFFDMAKANCIAFFVDGQGEDESKDDDADPDDDVPEDAMATSMGDDPATKKKKKISKRTAGYTAKEDVFLCRSWLAISQDAISGAEQKGKAYWKRVTVDYHQQRQLKPFKIHSDRGQVSIQKWWSLIQMDTNKFCGAIEHVLGRRESGVGIADMARPSSHVKRLCSNFLPYEWPPFHDSCRFRKPWSTSRAPMKASATAWSIIGECSRTSRNGSSPTNPSRNL